MRQMVAIPAAQVAVAIVAKQGLQPRVFHVIIAEHDLSLSLMPGIRPAGAARWVVLTNTSSPPQATPSINDDSAVAYESIPDGHHIGRVADLRLRDGLVCLEWRYRQRRWLISGAHPRTQAQRAVSVKKPAGPSRIIPVINIDNSLGKCGAGGRVCRWTVKNPCWLPRFPASIQPIPVGISSQRIHPHRFWESVRRVDAFHREGISAVIRYELLQRHAELTQIIAALSLLRFGFGLRKRWQKQRGENSDDGDDNQQFGQRESRAAGLVRCSHT